MRRTPLWERLTDATFSMILALIAFAVAAALASHLLGSSGWIFAALAAGRAAAGWVLVGSLVAGGGFFLLHALIRGRWGLSDSDQITLSDKRSGPGGA